MMNTFSNFDRFVDNINKAIMEEMRRDYSEKVVEIFLNPINMGRIEGADGYGKLKGPCGDTMEIFLKIGKDLISDARFITDGCGPSIVCGTMVTELAKDRSINKAGEINAEKVLDELGGLPKADQHCAKLAADTLRQSISNYLKVNMNLEKNSK
jgi:nitrogen fixation protein NifU and related proteins